MKYSYNWIKELSGTNIQPQKMAELLTMHTFEVEGAERSGDDHILSIDVLPNRTHDCLSHQGVAREVGRIAAFKHSRKVSALKTADHRTGFDKIKNVASEMLKVEIRDKNFGSRYLGVIINGLKVKSSPQTIQRQLAALGVKVINNLVDVTNYVMLETGMPLHAFDLDRIEGGTMTLRGAKKGEQITTLDGVMRALPEGTLVIEDAKGLIDLAGTMGGARSAVSSSTTRVFLQAAIFDAARIGRSTREMGFFTEASVRYAADIAPILAETGLMRAIELLEAEGGKVVGKIDVYPRPALIQPIPIEPSYVRRLLGVDIAAEKISDILESVGCKIKKKGKSWKVRNFPAGAPSQKRVSDLKRGGNERIVIVPPSVRLDLRTPEDLIEEIGRIIGYENIPPVMPVSMLVPASPTEEIVFAERLRDALVAAGMTETYNYSLIPDPGVPETLTLENPMSDRRNYLRPSLLPGLIQNAGDNMRFFDEVRMFETGKIFRKSKVKGQKSKVQPKTQNFSTIDGVEERSSIGGILAHKVNSEDLFYELKGILAGLFDGLRAGGVWFDSYGATAEPATIPGIWDQTRTAEIKFGDREVGFLGMVKQTERFSVAAFELDVEALMEIAQGEQAFRPIPKYPAVIRDISILINPDVRIAEVENAIENSGAKYIQDVDLFDIFEPDDEQSKGDVLLRKSIAFHIIYQADDRTLTDKEVNQEHVKVEQMLREALSAEIR